MQKWGETGRPSPPRSQSTTNVPVLPETDERLVVFSITPLLDWNWKTDQLLSVIIISYHRVETSSPCPSERREVTINEQAVEHIPDDNEINMSPECDNLSRNASRRFDHDEFGIWLSSYILSPTDNDSSIWWQKNVVKQKESQQKRWENKYFFRTQFWKIVNIKVYDILQDSMHWVFFFFFSLTIFQFPINACHHHVFRLQDLVERKMVCQLPWL